VQFVTYTRRHFWCVYACGSDEAELLYTSI